MSSQKKINSNLNLKDNLFIFDVMDDFTDCIDGMAYIVKSTGLGIDTVVSYVDTLLKIPLPNPTNKTEKIAKKYFIQTDDGASKKFKVISIIPAIIIILKIVPKPGFCLINIHKKSTDTLIKKVAVPIDKLVVLDIPSASTDHGEFPVVDKIKRPSPNPKIAKPKIKKKDVDNFGLKLKELTELQDTIGIFLIFRNIF